ncbi:ECF-type sigma factor [Tahibacter soli]|uniref:ECF-type sigma factor n=1 Tax=Tahibacter soli TaxID=2983605 RepID=A0A9X4BMM2_9GAMM|nr:ECF-type sigma factor [Tahibacter soli]MDC8015479.1 ECF-type sigma factor [Tahibacter soli]
MRADQEQASHSGLTELLQSWQRGDGRAFARLFERVYTQLKDIAAQRLREMNGVSTLTPTELLHEAVLRVVDSPMDWKNRAHFFATMSLLVRSALVDHARARVAVKRGGHAVRVTLTHADPGEESIVADVLSLDQALTKLEGLDARSSEVLHLTYFAGLDRQQIVDVLGVSLSTVDRELKFARAWLSRELEQPL